MSKTFLLEIVTPERISYQEQVEMVSVPSETGRLGILPGHTSLLANLVEGELKIAKAGQDYHLAIGGGFLEITKQKTTILVTRAVDEDELNEKAILEAKKRAEEALKAKPEGEELKNAHALLRSTLLDLKILSRKRRKYREIKRPIGE